MAAEEQTIIGYIQHHLTNLTYGKLPAGYERVGAEGEVVETLAEGSWVFARNPQEIGDMGFWALHVDSLAWAVLLGGASCLLFCLLARKATSVVPSRTQNSFELSAECIDNTVRDTVPYSHPKLAPLALAAFMRW